MIIKIQKWISKNKSNKTNKQLKLNLIQFYQQQQQQNIYIVEGYKKRKKKSQLICFLFHFTHYFETTTNTQ